MTCAERKEAAQLALWISDEVEALGRISPEKFPEEVVKSLKASQCKLAILIGRIEQSHNGHE
jgi:hypothetical protein